MTKNKIVNLKDLKEYSEIQRKNKKKIILAHGTFDVLHIGHIKHLTFAKKNADILIVTLTADKFVKKGPDRPVFKQENRAEMLAALEIVDKICIINSPSAIEAISNVKPDYYVKGIEYKNTKNDITNKISKEISILKKNKGKIIYSNDETFSSSNLINNFFSHRTNEQKLRLRLIGKRNILKKIINDENRISKLKICIIGDTILDIYRFISPMGKSPKENVITNQFISEKKFAGGVLAAANNLSSFCNNIEIITHCYNTKIEKNFVFKSLNKKIKITNFKNIKKPITKKIRYIENGFNRKLFSIYEIDDNISKGKYETQIISYLNNKLKKFDLVIAADFGHGFISENIIKCLQKNSKFLSVNAQSNSANHGFNLITKYKRANYICIDLPEAKLAVKNKFATPLEIATKLLPKTNKFKYFSLTLGKNGCLICKNKNTFELDSFTKNVIDTIGAGDVFFVLTSVFVYLKYNIEEIALIGNTAGCLKVNILGHEKSIKKEDFYSLIKSTLM
jgi:cytidyltransferase-like protein